MAKVISIKDMPTELKIRLVKELGYNSDGKYVLDKQGQPFLDKYTSDPVEINNMAILPGSTIIINDNPLSIMLYLDEYEDE